MSTPDPLFFRVLVCVCSFRGEKKFAYLSEIYVVADVKCL